MLLGGACRTADTVASGTSAKKKNHVSRRRAFATHVGCFHGTHHSAHLKSLGHIAFVVNLTHMGGGKTYLVAIAGISCGSLAADDALRKLAGKSFTYRLCNIARSGHTHGLIHIRTAGKRVADGASKTGGSPSERFYLGRMVVGLVLELEKPFLLLPVHIHIDEHRAGVVLLALLHVVQQAFVAQVARTDSG